MTQVRVLTGDELIAALDQVAVLRIAVFRDWPYLYEGDLSYERKYLQSYVDSSDAVLVGAFDHGRLVGAATGTPLEDHAQDFAAAFEATGRHLHQVFYFAESILLPEYRGQGIGHRFFDLREEDALTKGRRFAAFCSVIRPPDHPMRPNNYRPLDGFWRKRGYEPMDGVVARFRWTDVGEQNQSDKELQFWGRSLSSAPA